MKSVTSNGWEAIRLGKAGSIITGKTPPTSHPQYFGDAYPFITPGDMHVEKHVHVTARGLSEEGARFLASKRVPSGSICVSCIGWQMGEVVVVGAESFTNQQLNTLIPNGTVNADFIYYCLKPRKEELLALGSAIGVRTPILKKSAFADLRILVPAGRIQKKIASILSAYDDLIENNLRRIKTLEEMSQGLYREWFAKFRFAGDKSADFIDSPLGPIPKGWEVRSALENRHFSFIHQNIRPYDGKKRYYATADIDGITITGEGLEFSYDQKPSRAQKQPPLHSVWVARMQETYKVLPVARPNGGLVESCMLSSGFAGFQANDEASFPFLFLTINSKEFHSAKDRYCTGATQRSITNDGLRRILTLSPPGELVRQFGRLVGPFLELLLTLQRQSQALRSARDLLLPKLISGELNVSELDIVAPAGAA